jgi:short-chain fatty acids transporter
VGNTVLTESATDERGLARVAQRMAAWTEKWFPDAYIFALAGVA